MLTSYDGGESLQQRTGRFALQNEKRNQNLRLKNMNSDNK